MCATQFDDYLRRNLLRPFGMSSSGLLPAPTVSDRAASGHREDGKPTGRPPATPITAARYGAAGGLLTTVVDYARFLIEVLDQSRRTTSESAAPCGMKCSGRR